MIYGYALNYSTFLLIDLYYFTMNRIIYPWPICMQVILKISSATLKQIKGVVSDQLLEVICIAMN